MACALTHEVNMASACSESDCNNDKHSDGYLPMMGSQ